MMDDRSRKALSVLPAVVLSALVLAGGLFFGRSRAWGPEFDAIAADFGWLLLGAALVAVAMGVARRAGRGMDAARDDDAYYRRSHFGSD